MPKQCFLHLVAGVGLPDDSLRYCRDMLLVLYILKIKKSTNSEKSVLSASSSGGWTRTNDLRVMSPTSSQLLHPAV